MYKDDKKRKDAEAELAAGQSGNGESLNNLIADDGMSESQQDADIESIRSKHSISSKKGKSGLNKDLEMDVVPALSENHN